MLSTTQKMRPRHVGIRGRALASVSGNNTETRQLVAEGDKAHLKNSRAGTHHLGIKIGC